MINRLMKIVPIKCSRQYENLHSSYKMVIGAGTTFPLGEQKLAKNNQDNQIQNITLCGRVVNNTF